MCFGALRGPLRPEQMEPQEVVIYLGIMFNLYTVLSFGQDNPKNRLYCSYIILTLSSICEGAGVAAHLTRFGKVLKNLLFS